MSTIPAVVERIVVVPYETDWSIPQYWDAGDVFVKGLMNIGVNTLGGRLQIQINAHRMLKLPVYLLLLAPPKRQVVQRHFSMEPRIEIYPRLFGRSSHCLSLWAQRKLQLSVP